MQIRIKVIPKSSENKIIKENPLRLSEASNIFKIKITDVPEKGKANEKIIKLLAKEFKISKSQVEIIKGLTSRNKIVKINL